ncbi:hypothetical protein [Paenibacillus planticolens]|uniref:hypothetical protein n=1 Tax=Paenibacillus planticolens TaxID=2654976 RepID=UPI001492D05E|nr:hypothetical protein [Paenibacillus planticolens]
MRKLNWREATSVQLYNIAFLDEGAALEHIQAARDELLRRAKKRHSRVNFKEKVAYPR